MPHSSGGGSHGGGRVDYNIKCNTKNMDIILTFV